MPAQEIPRQNWPTFTEAFARQHQDWLVTVEVAQSGQSGDRPDGSPKVETLAEQQPLRGFTLARSADEVSFWLALGEPREEVVRQILEPSKVVFQTDENGAHEGLRIDTKSGEVLHLHFRAAARPEELNGIE